MERPPTRRVAWLILGILAILPQVRAADLTDEQVRQAIRGAARYLKDQQLEHGGWADTVFSNAAPGVTALVTLALLNAGEEVQSPPIQKALQRLREQRRPGNVYGTSLQTMVLCAAEPNRDRALIAENVAWLEKAQMRSGPRVGSWSYDDRGRGNGDNSNTQFALLALHEAERIGVKVNPQTWQSALDYWLRNQRADGSWNYMESELATGSMTCAGIASVIICSGRAVASDATVQDGRLVCCGTQANQDAVERGLQWLGNHFSVTRNPGAGAIGRSYWLYYLYALERVGRMSGRRFIGNHDWFREGAEVLVSLQDDVRQFWVGEGSAEGQPLVATSLALLFLAKGRRPVVIAKAQTNDGSDWDYHRSAVQNLTLRAEQRWKRDLSWQTVDLRAATATDLAQTPVLFLSGRDGLSLTPQQEANLKQYLDQGGFLFAEACCSGTGFDRDFRALMQRLFPESPLRLLPPDHPVWFAEQTVPPEYLKPLYGIDACCRTSVVYAPQDLSCQWELSSGARESPYPEQAQREIEAGMRMGVNVLTYATNREVRNKLDQLPLAGRRPTGETPTRATLYVPKLRHSGGGDDAPNALPNLLDFVRQKADLRVVVENRLIHAADPGLTEYPLVFIHGRRSFRFSPAERQALTRFFERGGVLFGDAICGSPEFARSFREEVGVLFPGRNLERIPPTHPLFTPAYHGFDLPKVTVRDPQVRGQGDPLRATLNQISPVLEGLSVEDRLVVVFSPLDLSCALESGASLQCQGYLKEDAARLGTNILLGALLQ